MSTVEVERSTRAHWLLGGRPADAALVAGDTVMTYAELHEAVAAQRDRLGPRELVALEARPTIEFVVSYLAALADRRPVLLLAAGDPDRQAGLTARYPPGTTTGLHPDLALLLSTSGSTGSPKLVRLSATNVLANARSIAEYLDLRSSDVAITSLPLHYCYGLSVLNTHLLVGATVVLTDLSVADACFWDLVEQHAVTGVAGVPHTYALLEAIGFDRRVLPRLPSLRYLTQAGGRMTPDRVRDYAGLLGEHGVDLFVMYGQTEATARMAYLPPQLAQEHPDTVGVAVPGGALRIEAVPGAALGTGELVYAGPNVMMGYAESLGDLARAAELTELRTGDLARVTDAGLVQILGRLDRHAKVLGHRIDLDRVERLMAEAGSPVRLVARPDRLWVFTADVRARDRVRQLVASATDLRGAALQVVALDPLPVTSSGKPDDAALRRHVQCEESLRADDRSGPLTAEEVRDLYAVVLARPDATTADSFVTLGGDSLSFVEISTRLSQRVDLLPPEWPSLPASELAARRPLGAGVPRRRGVAVDMSVALRAMAITLVVGTHADLAQLQGGAHVLLAVAGYNLARFQLNLPSRRARVLGMLRTVRQVALPAGLFIGALAAIGHQYHWTTALLLNGLLGDDSWDDQWQFWFLETLAWSYVGLAALLALPPVARAERAGRFTAALVLLGATLGVRYWWTGIESGATERYTLGVVLWCLALGICAARAERWWQRALVAVITVAATAGFFGDGRRESIFVVGVLLLLLGRPLRLPRWAASTVGILASASLWIYLTHWQVYPALEDSGHQVLAVLASLGVGAATNLVTTTVGRACRRHSLRWRGADAPTTRDRWRPGPISGEATEQATTLRT